MTAEDSITVWGTGEEKRDLLHVSDLLDFVECALNNQGSAYELFNVGYGSAVSIRQLVSMIISESGKNIAVDHDLTKPTIKTNVYLNCDKARDVVGWSPKISLEEGISSTLSWYRDNIMGAAGE